MTPEQQNKRAMIEYQRKLDKLLNNDYTQVIADSLNLVVGYAHNRQKRRIKELFTVRSPYTLNSLKFWQAKSQANLERINAVTGTISPYLAIQEEGGTKKPRRGRKLPIPTWTARGGSFSGRIRRKYYAGSTRGEKYFTGRIGGGHLGIFERYGGKRNPKIRMIRNLEKSQAHIKATHWHQDSVSKFTKQSVIFGAFKRYAEIALRKAGAK